MAGRGGRVLQPRAHVTTPPSDVKSRVRAACALPGVPGAIIDPEPFWEGLEEAHVLSQPFAWLHIRTHAAMFWLAIRTRDSREIRGQAIRLVLAGPGSLTGRYPEGNSGRSNVSMFEPMPVRPSSKLD